MKMAYLLFRVDGLLIDNGIEDILAIILNIQKQLERFRENLDKIADLIADHVEDFGNFIAEYGVRK